MSGDPGQQYIIRSAVLYSDRMEDFWDVQHLIAELKITETASRPYVIGQVAIADQLGFLRSMHIKGSERLEIIFGPDVNSKGLKPITRTFVLRSLNAVVNNDVFVYDLIEEVGYLASTKVISQAYTDQLPVIVYNIVKNKLGYNIGVPYATDNKPSNAGKRTHVVIPYMTAWDTIKWLTDRHTGETGTPWFCSGSLFGGDDKRSGAAYWSLESALRSEPWNKDFPFIKSERFSRAAGSSRHENSLEAAQAITAYYEGRTESMHSLDRANAVAGLYDQVDTNNNVVSSLHYSAQEVMSNLDNRDYLQISNDIVDPSFAINDKLIAFEPSCSMMQATSSGTYLLGDSYQDDTTEAGKKNRLANKVFKNFMIQNTITAHMDGRLYAAVRAIVGSKVRWHFEDGDRVTNTGEPGLDPKLSGDYIITGITHLFQGTEYTVTVDGVKFYRSGLEKTFGRTG